MEAVRLEEEERNYSSMFVSYLLPVAVYTTLVILLCPEVKISSKQLDYVCNFSTIFRINLIREPSETPVLAT